MVISLLIFNINHLTDFGMFYNNCHIFLVLKLGNRGWNFVKRPLVYGM